LSEQVKPYNQEDSSKKEQVEQMFDNIAGRYDFLNRLLSVGIDKLWRRKVINILRPHKPKLILDVATGTADLALALNKLNPDKIIGIDIAEKMLEIGRTKIKNKNLPDKIELLKGDSEEIQFQDNFFDAVTVAFGVRNFENLDKGLSEIFRVTKKGGIVTVLEFSKPTVFPVKQFYSFYFNFILPAVGKLFSGDQRAYKYLPESVRVFPVGKEFEKRLQSAGFKKTSCKRLSFGIASIYIAEK